MNISGYGSVRISDLARAMRAGSQIARTQADMARTELELSTGRRLINPSDDAGDASAAQQLRRVLEQRQGYETNLQQGRRFLADIDEALAGATDLIREARTIAMANLGTEVSDAEREGAAVVLRQIERRLIDIANSRSGGLSLFGGDADRDPYALAGDGVRFFGSDRALANAVGDGAELGLLMAGSEIFGGASLRVGDADLTPAVTGATRLADLAGARGEGMPRGSIRIVNAGSPAVIDLSAADTVDNVLNAINASGIGVTASIVGGNAIQISGAAVTVSEAGGTTAASLGLLKPPGAIVTGDDLGARLGHFTPLSALRGGAGIDLAGTFTISNGAETDTVDLAGLTTVGDLLDRFNTSPTRVRAAISDDGKSLLVQNTVQGTDMHIRDATGTAAQDLGWLTFTADDALAEFNGGRGVRLDPAGPDLAFTDAGAIRFEVDLDGAGTAQDVIDRINAAAATAGSTLVASFDPAGPGIALSNLDRVVDVGASRARVDLGLDGAVSAGALAGRDVNPVTSEGLFGHLHALIGALESNDMASAERALGDLEADESQVVLHRGEAGARLQEAEGRLERLADQNLLTEEMLSKLEHADLTETILRYQALQTSLQASLQTTGQFMGLSLFDFLR